MCPARSPGLGTPGPPSPAGCPRERRPPPPRSPGVYSPLWIKNEVPTSRLTAETPRPPSEEQASPRGPATHWGVTWPSREGLLTQAAMWVDLGDTMPRDLCHMWKDKSCGTSPHVAGSQRHRVGGGDRGWRWRGVSAHWGQFQFGRVESSGDGGGAVLNSEKALRSPSPTLVWGRDGSPLPARGASQAGLPARAPCHSPVTRPGKRKGLWETTGGPAVRSRPHPPCGRPSPPQHPSGQEGTLEGSLHPWELQLSPQSAPRPRDWLWGTLGSARS